RGDAGTAVGEAELHVAAGRQNDRRPSVDLHVTPDDSQSAARGHRLLGVYHDVVERPRELVAVVLGVPEVDLQIEFDPDVAAAQRELRALPDGGRDRTDLAQRGAALREREELTGERLGTLERFVGELQVTAHRALGGQLRPRQIQVAE